MLSLELQPHVSFGLIGERPVFLDLTRDRYLTLAGSQASAFQTLRGGAVPLPGSEAARLLETGLFRPASAPAAILPAAAPAGQWSLLDDMARKRPRLLATLKAELLAMRMRRRLRATRLQDIVTDLRTLRAGRHVQGDEARCAALAADFISARRMAAGAPSCLPDSLALLDWLGSQSIFPTLIFGVKLHPFKAHCWVQAGSLLLNDSADRVAEFTPVLVVE